MSKNKDKLREEILSKVEEYYEIAFKEDEFQAGKSRVNYGGRFFGSEELVSLVDSSLDFWLTYGRYSKKFEKNFAEYLGVKHSLLVNSGSSANFLALASLTSPLMGDRRICKGDEVITVAAGFPTTVAPIIQHGLVPVFVDIELPTYNIDCNYLNDALSDKTKAVMVAHTLGNPFDLSFVKDFCDKNNLWLVEDNCDALGSLYEGKLTGTYGDVATSSFYPPHHMTMGEGGAVYTSNDAIYQALVSLRDWGRDCYCVSGIDNTCGKRFSMQQGLLPRGYDHKYVYSHFGYNLKVTDMQAAIGCVQLERLVGFTKDRQSNFNILKNVFSKFDKYFILPEATKNSEPSWFGFPVTVKDNSPFTRDDAVKFFEDSKIQTRMLFAGNITRQPCFDEMRESGVGYRTVGDLKVTDKVMTSTFWLGVYPGITSEMIDYMTGKVKEFMEGHV